MRIELGQIAKDRVTGFTGIVVTRAEHLYGSTQLAIQARSSLSYEPGKLEWFDVARVVPYSGPVCYGDDNPPTAFPI